MPAQGNYSPRLLARAEAGTLTRSNTLKGTPERRAVDRVTYLRRKAARPNVSAREAAGGKPKRPRVIGITETDREQIAAGLGDAEARRKFAAFRQSSRFPGWLPKDPADMDDQTAAILAALPKALDARTLSGARNGWKDIQFATRDDGTVEITVTPIRGGKFTFILPDQDSASQLLSVIRKANYKGLTIDTARFGSTILQTQQQKTNKGKTPPGRKTKR
jgi:hypothetical protein